MLSLTGFFIILPFALLLKRAPYKVAGLPHGERAGAVNHDTVEKQADGDPDGYSLLQAVKTRNFWMLFFTWSLAGFCYYTIITHLVPHAMDLGITPTTAASMLSIAGGASIIGSVLIGIISDSIGRKKAIISCSLLLAGAMLWLTWSSNLGTLYLFAAAFGIAFGGLLAPLGALTGDTFGLRHIGKIMAVMEGGWMLGGAVGPAFTGYVFDISGSYSFGFLGGMLAALISVALLLLFKTRNDSLHV